MKIQRAIFISLVLFLTGPVTTADGQSMEKTDPKPEKVTLCQLKTDPAAYNHKLVEVTAFASKGFEGFTLFDPACSDGPPNVWLEYGGTIASGTMYCCGISEERSRPKQLVVEKIPIPLVDDEVFRTFDKLLQKPPDSTAHATLAGRFFSGEKNEIPGGTSFRNYGHFGCCSLLAIQQVLSVDTKRQDTLDYGASYDQPETSKPGCGYKYLSVRESGRDLIRIQQNAEAEANDTIFTNPEQVAIGTMARILKTDEGSIKLKQTRKAQGRFVYWWKPESKSKNYMVVVSRPYWLSFYAKDPKKTAWVVVALYETSCG